MFPASFGPDGQVVVKDGWRITQRVDEPMGYQPPEASLGVVVTDGVHTRWMLLTRTRSDGWSRQPDRRGLAHRSSADDPGKGYSRFEDWLASMVELQRRCRAPRRWSPSTRATGSQPGPGATLVETRPAPVIDDYTTDGDRLAEVRARRPDLVRRRPRARAAGGGHPVDAEVLPAPTFAALVDHLASQVASDEGLR